MFTVTIPDEAWSSYPSSEDDGRSVLLTTLVVNGCLVHLEAHAVAVDDEGTQINGGADSDFETLASAFDGDGHMETVEITGRTYALFAHPFR